MANLGRTHREAGRLHEADKLLRQATESWEKLQRHTDADYIQTLIDLGKLQDALSEPHRSYSFLRVAYENKRKEGKKDLVQSDAARALGLYFLD